MKLTPVKVSNEEAKVLSEQINNQDLSTSIKASQDPKFPMFRYETLHKHLLYFPQIDAENFDEELHGLADRTNTVGVKLNGSSFYTELRNTQGITTMTDRGISGESPLQELLAKRNELFSLKQRRLYKENGIDEGHQVDMTSSSDPAVKLIQSISESIPVSGVKEKIIMPVVSIQLEQVDGIQPKKDAEGKTIKSNGWLVLSKTAYGKLKKSISNMTKPQVAGNFFIFDYTSDTISPDAKDARMRCANTMTISKIDDENLKAFAPQLDEFIKDWTLEKLWDTVTVSLFLTDEDLTSMTSSIADKLDAMIATERALANGSGGTATIETTKETVQIGQGNDSTKQGLENFTMEETVDKIEL